MSVHMVVLGGGYGGMLLLRTILERLPDDVRITLVDRLPKSPLKTEFYSIAAGTAALKEVTVPFPVHPRLTVLYDEVLKIDSGVKRIHLRENDPLVYDTLVVALGCVDRYHGIAGADEYSHSLQSLKKAQMTGQAILTLDAYRSVVLIGAGLTGIELAAGLRETRHDLNIMIIDRNDLVLNGFSDKMRRYVERWLTKHDVRILHRFSTREVLPDRLVYDGGELPYDRLVWTAGIEANPLVRALPCKVDSIGRAVVNEFQQLPDDPSVYVIGDCAASELPPTAQLAEFHGEYAAEVLLAQWNGETPRRRSFQDKGMLGSLGSGTGFGQVRGVDLSGRIPRLLKSGVLWSYKKHVE